MVFLMRMGSWSETDEMSCLTQARGNLEHRFAPKLRLKDIIHILPIFQTLSEDLQAYTREAVFLPNP